MANIKFKDILSEASKRKLSSSDMKKIEKVVDDAETMISSKFDNPEWRDDYSTKDMIDIIVTQYNDSGWRNKSLKDLLDVYDVKKQKDNVYSWHDEMQEGISLPNKPRLTESREFVIIDPRGNARPVGMKAQGAQYIKKMGGPGKGYHMVLAKNALKARRAIEKNGGNATNSKIQDIMFDLMYEGKLTEGKKENDQISKLLKIGAKATIKMGEDKLYKLSQAFEDWNVDNDDKYDDTVDHLFMAIEIVQDAGEPGKNNVTKDKEYYSYLKSAAAHLKKFNKDCVKALKGLSEGKLTEGDNTQYSWGQINKALMKYGMSPKHILRFLSTLKKI